jgi:hypothetical protein
MIRRGSRLKAEGCSRWLTRDWLPWSMLMPAEATLLKSQCASESRRHALLFAAVVLSRVCRVDWMAAW